MEPPTDSDDLFRIYAVLLQAKGEQVTDADVHNAWCAWMQSVNSQHNALIPFEDLAPETRAEDAPYTEAIRAAAHGLERGPEQ
ncbi:hypothetical protein AB0C98_23730 [Streptomyces sp. NPDC048558]|uniref:DUF7701 domain-containing protein n=1 Tax=Streptomyces sp. NPDC048558 TaxID=3155759 RepID=UPI0034416E52